MEKLAELLEAGVTCARIDLTVRLTGGATARAGAGLACSYTPAHSMCSVCVACSRRSGQGWHPRESSRGTEQRCPSSRSRAEGSAPGAPAQHPPNPH